MPELAAACSSFSSSAGVAHAKPAGLRGVGSRRNIVSGGIGRSYGSSGVKRCLDLAIAVPAAALTAPIVALAAICIRLESPGDALFRQLRMGRDGVPFRMFKLRGMHVDARERFPELYDYAGMSARDPSSVFFHRADDDPRVTRVGRVIRRYSIDELPNFWNVIRGEMSVVGPRPEIPELAHLYGADLARLLSVRPGITSPAKATGRDRLSVRETLEQDLAYIERQSLRLDIQTIVRTFRALLRPTNVA